MRPPNAFEQRVLDVLLVELRRAMRRREQLSIVVDPFTMGSGTYVFAAPNEEGRTYTIERPATRRPKEGKRCRR